MNGLVAAHSGLRYIVLALLLVAIVNALMNMKSNSYVKKDRLINLFTMISLHIQLVLGLILYFVSPKVQFVEGMMSGEPAHLRFYAVEHIILMLLSIILITLGRKRAEIHPDPGRKHKLIFRYYGLGLILIFIAIPWPFIYENLGAGYF